ncbi:hypothetical protein C1645_825630 [Glomus cerebriforme]|uniref:Protein kinase domain-containing protein n=1 Tax=Glomus cerebriforme TaxID=658196 RepID=A0A397SYL3_9GLOM|nr:hypothetical protein C1645_825630 [Glomus cerebriforme]
MVNDKITEEFIVEKFISPLAIASLQPILRNLNEILCKLKKKETKVFEFQGELEYKIAISIQISDAVSCIHLKNIIHHDLYSDDILVHQNMIKITDFELSFRLAEASTQIDFLECDHYQKLALMLEISNGKREIPISGTPIDYINIYTNMQQVFSNLKNGSIMIEDNNKVQNDEISTDLIPNIKRKKEKSLFGATL